MVKRWFAAGITLLACLLLVGCGIPQEEHDAVVAERDAAQTQVASLQSDLTEARGQIDTLEGDLQVTQSDLASTQDGLEAAEAQISTLTEERDKAESDLSSAQSRASSLQSQVSALQSEVSTLQSAYDSASAELTEIKQVYPARYFSSASELRDWLAGNDISERPDVALAESLIDKALALQEDALADGYIMSLWLDEEPDAYYVGCTALIDGYIWLVDVETDEALQYPMIGRIR